MCSSLSFNHHQLMASLAFSLPLPTCAALLPDCCEAVPTESVSIIAIEGEKYITTVPLSHLKC